MSYFEFNDPILSTKRKGTGDDPYVQITQSIVVERNKVLLAEIPDSFNRVIVEGAGVQWYETVEALPDENGYAVDYSLGIVTFHSSRNNLELTFSYYGTGADYFPASRIWTGTDGTMVTETLEEVVGNSREAIINLNNLTNIIDTAQQLETDLSSDIVDATNIQVSLSGNISEGGSLNSSLASSIPIANTAKEDLDTSISNANASNYNLTNSISSADVLKQGLDNDIATANTLKDDLNLIVQDGNSLNSSLESNIVTAQNVTTTINGAVVEGQNKIQEMDSKILETDEAITNTNNACSQVLDTDTQLKVWEEYDNLKSYLPLNKVYYNGSSYVCISPCSGALPTDQEKWQLIAMRGLDGQGAVDSVNGYTGAIVLTADDVGSLAKSVYDANNNGIVDNAEMVNGYTVLSNVPANLQSTIDAKVDKVEGMGLSSNDYTTSEKTKVNNLSAVAETGNYADLLNTPVLGTASARNIGSAADEIPVLDMNGKLNSSVLPQLTKGDVGLSNVDNIQQASKTEFDSHAADTSSHVTSAEKDTWNSKANSVHYHITNDVTDLQTYLNSNYIPKNIVTAANDFIVGTGASAVARKTAAEALAILTSSLTWANVTPTLSWTGATPNGIMGIYRYLKIGKTCFIKVYIDGSDGNGATNLTITLPDSSFNAAGWGATCLAGAERTNAVSYYPLPYIEGSSRAITFEKFNTLVDGASFIIEISGCYELA